MTEPINKKEVAFFLWFEPFDLWRMRRVIRNMAGEGFELDVVIPPSLKKQRLTLSFASKENPDSIEVKFLLGKQKNAIENHTILWTVVSDYLWIPLGYYYFLKKI